jgi:hypothetical protein
MKTGATMRQQHSALEKVSRGSMSSPGPDASNPLLLLAEQT